MFEPVLRRFVRRGTLINSSAIMTLKASTFGGSRLAQTRIMYWKEIPVQVQAKDDQGAVSRQLHERFQQGVDAISMFDGSAGSDEYLDAWEWGPFSEFDGAAEDSADALVERLNSGFPQDFVARVRDLHRDGQRDPKPGAVDHWIGGG